MQFRIFTCIGVSSLMGRRFSNTLSRPHWSAFRFVQLVYSKSHRLSRNTTELQRREPKKHSDISN